MPWTVIEETQMEYDYQSNLTNAVKCSYVDAIRMTLEQALSLDDSIFVMGQGINDQVGMFGMTNGLCQMFGEERVFDTPIAETGLTGVAVGSAMAGMHPVYFHNRPDFLFLAMDQLINHATKYHFMSGGQYNVPLVLWAVTGQGWGSAAQHSQTIHGMLMHIPGLKIAMPTTPYDARGLLIEALADRNPVVFLDHRRIHNQKGEVPVDLYRLPFGKGIVRREGEDITIVGISSMLLEALKAAAMLEQENIYAEVIDLRTIKPYDRELIARSVRKTGRLLIADTGWECCGAASEIAAKAYEDSFGYLKNAIQIVALPNIPTPAAYNLEEVFYQSAKDIYSSALKICK